MTTTGSERVAVVGAGLAGCLLATLLARRGLTVDVYERRDDPRRAGAERGRSINLAISARGLDALGRVGLDERTLDDALPMRGRTLHSPTGALAYQSYSADGTRAINSISRAGLNHALLDRAEETPGVRLHFGRRLVGVDAETGELTFDDGDTARADVVLGADGAYSAVRRSIQHGMDLHQDFLPHGYKELTIPARDGRFALDPGSLHIWPRGASMMIALPNTDRSFTCTLFWAKADFAALDTPERVLAEFRERYPDAVDADAHAGGGLPGQPGGLAGHRAVRAVGAGPGGARRRRRARDRAVLRAGRELRVRGLRRARPQPHRHGRRLAHRARPLPGRSASPTPTPSPTWRWRTSWR